MDGSRFRGILRFEFTKIAYSASSSLSVEGFHVQTPSGFGGARNCLMDENGKRRKMDRSYAYE